MAENGKTYAVLTGDIVASSRYQPRQLRNLMAALRRGADEFARAFPGVVAGKLDVFSGDGWQVLLNDWRKACRLALFLRATVKADARLKADTRVAVGVGGVDRATLKLGKISESTGDAFERSGLALRALKKPFLMTWAVPGAESGGESPQDRLLAGSMQLLDELVSRWKPGQARSVRLALLGKRQEQIARTLRVTQPVVSESLNNAGWRGIERFLVGTEI